MSAYAEEHAACDADSHDDEADTENRIETCNDLIDREHGSQEVVGKNDDEPWENFPAGQFCQEHCRACHEYGADEDKKNDREDTHDVQHGAAHLVANDFRNTVSVFTDGHHAGEVVMYAAGENGTEDNP